MTQFFLEKRKILAVKFENMLIGQWVRGSLHPFLDPVDNVYYSKAIMQIKSKLLVLQRDGPKICR